MYVQHVIVFDVVTVIAFAIAVAIIIAIDTAIAVAVAIVARTKQGESPRDELKRVAGIPEGHNATDIVHTSQA